MKRDLHRKSFNGQRSYIVHTSCPNRAPYVFAEKPAANKTLIIFAKTINFENKFRLSDNEFDLELVFRPIHKHII